MLSNVLIAESIFIAALYFISNIGTKEAMYLVFSVSSEFWQNFYLGFCSLGKTLGSLQFKKTGKNYGASKKVRMPNVLTAKLDIEKED